MEDDVKRESRSTWTHESWWKTQRLRVKSHQYQTNRFDFCPSRFMLMIQINTRGGTWFSLVGGGVKLPLISWDCHTLPSSCMKQDDACFNSSWLCWNFIFHLQKLKIKRVLLWMFELHRADWCFLWRLVLNTIVWQRQTFNGKHF